MATIKIKRADGYIGRKRDYQIFIDGQLAGTIGNKEVKEFPITAGQHTVTAKIDWCSSLDVSIDIDANETKSLTVRIFKYANVLGFMSFGVVLLYFILLVWTMNFLYLSVLFTILMMPFMLILVYYGTIGKNKYLILKEIDSKEKKKDVGIQQP
jgi:hypothetical protein